MDIGIGPRATLEKYGIPVISELPGVGQNLWDQILFAVTHQVNLPTASQLITEPQFASESQQQYLDDAAGPLSSMNGLIAFEKIPEPFRTNFTSAADSALGWFPSDWPEVEYISSTSVTPDGSGLGIILAALSASLSRGNVTIGSAQVSTPPIINLGWLTDPAGADAQVAVAAIKRIRQAWSKIANITVGPELTPGPDVQTDAEILAYVRNTTATLYHASATCAMGKKGDKNAVVDSSARVFGVQGLRVVDNSAAPFAVPGHPQGTVYMLAEKIAELIRRGS